MKTCSILLTVALIASVKTQEDDATNYYTAAVHEYIVRGDYENDTARQYIEKNLAAYETAASLAYSHNADILVFSEFGIYPSIPRDAVFDDLQYVPDPKTENWNPCLEPDRYQNSYVLTNLSCMAKAHNIVIVANILSKMPCNSKFDPKCPTDGVYMYNTNVAFNKSGLLIGRYRKTHLFFEDDLNVLPEPEYIVFETDFGKVGTFICFDIVWKEAVEMVQKHSPDAIAFTTVWFEYLQPAMTASQIQQSWAIRNNVTVLAANRQRPRSGSLGSGVLFGDTGIGNYVYVPDGQSRLLISKVPRPGVRPLQNYPPPTIIEFGDNLPYTDINNISSGICSRKILGDPVNKQDYRCYDINISNFTLVKLQPSTQSVQACHNGLCCNVEYKAQLGDEDYYLAVFNGTYNVLNRYMWWLEACFVVRCDSFNGIECSTFPTKSNTVFNELNMEANFTTQYVYPSVSISGLQLIPRDKWSYTSTSLSIKTTEDKLLFATLNGRAYERDP